MIMKGRGKKGGTEAQGGGYNRAEVKQRKKMKVEDNEN
jgi:hypothetical protein